MQDLQKVWEIIDCNQFKKKYKICRPASISINKINKWFKYFEPHSTII